MKTTHRNSNRRLKPSIYVKLIRLKLLALINYNSSPPNSVMFDSGFLFISESLFSTFVCKTCDIFNWKRKPFTISKQRKLWNFPLTLLNQTKTTEEESTRCFNDTMKIKTHVGWKLVVSLQNDKYAQKQSKEDCGDGISTAYPHTVTPSPSRFFDRPHWPTTRNRLDQLWTGL